MTLPSTNETLQITHITKRYGSGTTDVTAVRDISLSVSSGEIVLIMGPSGSGKTTLLSMLGALLKPTEGTIQLNGTLISALAENRLPEIRLKQNCRRIVRSQIARSETKSRFHPDRTRTW